MSDSATPFQAPFLTSNHLKSSILYCFYVCHLATTTYPKNTTRRIDVDSMSILRRYIERKISTNLHVILTYLFDVISMGKKLTSLRLTFFDVIAMGENPRQFHVLFWCNFDGLKIGTLVTCLFWSVLKGIIWCSFWYLFLISFRVIKKENRLDVTLRLSFVLM